MPPWSALRRWLFVSVNALAALYHGAPAALALVASVAEPGALAGLGLVFAALLIGISFGFTFAAVAHGRAWRRRWWIQLAALLAMLVLGVLGGRLL